MAAQMFRVVGLPIAALGLLFTTVSLAGGPGATHHVPNPADPLLLAYGRECSQRMGPYATQTTAWQRYRQAQAQGYTLSTGVFPCYDGGVRGYCFNVFYAC